MVMVIDTYQMVYAPVPKVACSTLKAAMHLLKTGDRFVHEKLEDGVTPGPHDTYPSVPFDASAFDHLDDPWMFAVIRDPAERIASAWSNQVINEGKLDIMNRRRTARRGWLKVQAARLTGRNRLLPGQPSFEFFVQNLDEYIERYRPVRHHVESVTHFLGDDLDRYDRIYTMAELPQLERDIRARTGRTDFALEWRNKSGRKANTSLNELSDAAFDKLMTWLEPEYDLLSKWFTPPSRETRKLQQTGTI